MTINQKSKQSADVLPFSNSYFSAEPIFRVSLTKLFNFEFQETINQFLSDCHYSDLINSLLNAFRLKKNLQPIPKKKI